MFGITVAPLVAIEGPRYYDADSFTVRKRELWASWASRDRREGWTPREHALYLGLRLRQQLETGIEAMVNAPTWKTPEWLRREIERTLDRYDRNHPTLAIAISPRAGKAQYDRAIRDWTEIHQRGAYGLGIVPMPRSMVLLSDELIDRANRETLDAMYARGWPRRRRKKMKRSARYRAKKRGGL